MALKKQMSSLFKKRSITVIDPPLPQAQAEPSNPRILRSVQEDQDDELQAAIQESIEYDRENSRREIEMLQAALSAQPERVGMAQAQASSQNESTISNEIAELRGVIASLTDENMSLTVENASLIDENRSQRNHLEHNQRELSQQLQAAETKMKDLAFNNDMFKASNDQQRAEIKTKNETIESLEERLTWAEREGSDPIGNNLIRIQAALREENQGLRGQAKRFEQEKEKMLAFFQREKTEMINTTASYEVQLARAKADEEGARQALNAVAAASDNLDQFQSHFANTTPRSLLIMKSSISRAGPSAPVDSSCTRFSETNAIQHLSKSALDIPLSVMQATNFLESLRNNQEANLFQTLSLKVCALCKNSKFAKSSPGSALAERLHEFSGQTGCCSASICFACFPTAVFTGIENDWWHNLGSQAWIQCPIASCHAMASVKSIGELEVMLHRLGDHQLAAHLQMYVTTLFDVTFY
jgi:hypothetical protein